MDFTFSSLIKNAFKKLYCIFMPSHPLNLLVSCQYFCFASLMRFGSFFFSVGFNIRFFSYNVKTQRFWVILICKHSARVPHCSGVASHSFDHTPMSSHSDVPSQYLIFHKPESLRYSWLNCRKVLSIQLLIRCLKVN